jgi:hypothetical protein
MALDTELSGLKCQVPLCMAAWQIADGQSALLQRSLTWGVAFRPPKVVQSQPVAVAPVAMADGGHAARPAGCGGGGGACCCCLHLASAQSVPAKHYLHPAYSGLRPFALVVWLCLQLCLG